MDDDDYNLLVREINERNLKKGKVVKANGQWYIAGEECKVKRPIIKLPHWTEGTKKVVVEHEKQEM
ncbi:MAG: hypothetical protein IAF02_16525 [Anaerolineae bacterium]|nr:hypothetical protein [Anaerolineae bacterium]